MAVPIPVSFVNGDKPTSAQTNAWGKALNGLGIATDNDAKPIIPLSLDPPFALGLGGAEQTRAVGSSTTYTVPSGKLFYVRMWTGAGAGGSTVTPSGGAAISFATLGYSLVRRTGLCLMAGDAITAVASQRGYGLLVDVPTLPSTPTRILQTVTSAAPYTVPANRRLFLSHASAVTGSGLAFLTIDGVVVATVVDVTYAPTAANVQYGPLEPSVFTAGQALASSDTTPILISGLLYSA